MEIDRWGLLDKLRLSIDTWGVALPPYARLDEAIESMEKRYENRPASWVLAYTLGDLYQQAGRYADSIAVCQRCVELRPNDVRSRYALGTAYRMPELTIAQKREQCNQVPEPGLSLMISRHKARYWFQQAAEAAGPRSREFIAFHIQALEVQYRRLFGREMKPDFKRYLDVRHLSVDSAFLERYVTERIDELEPVQAQAEEPSVGSTHVNAALPRSDARTTNSLDRYADRLYDVVESGEVSVEDALRLLTLHQFTKYAHEIPLVNAKTRETESVQSTESTSAYEKYRAAYMLSDGEWEVDWGEFARLMETPEGEAHFEPLMPRIQKDVKEAVRRTGMRRQMLKGRQRSQNRPTVGRVFNVLRWLYKAIRVFSLLGR